MSVQKGNNLKQNTFLKKYDLRWQGELLALLVKDVNFAEQIKDVFEYTYFDDETHKIIAKYYYLYRDLNGEYPSIENLDIIIQYMGSAAEAEKIKGSLSILKERKPVANATFIKESALRFCKKRNVELSLEKIAEKISGELKDDDYETLLKIFENAVRASSAMSRGHIYTQQLHMRYEHSPRYPITTGIYQLDNITGGGLGKGELGLVIGGTGSGKSMFLTYMATRAMEIGFNVIYYTLELSETEIGKRVDASLTGIPLNMLRENRDMIVEKINEVKGNMVIKEYPTKQCSIQNIISHIEREKSIGNHPDIIFVDYVDLLKFSSKYTELRHNLQSTMEELRGLAKTYNVAVWTASQTNRDGYAQTNPGLEHVSEAFSKAFSTDISITIGRTDKEKQNGCAYYKIAKNRNGIDGVSFYGIMDTLRVSVSFEQPTEKEEEIDFFEKDGKNGKASW